MTKVDEFLGAKAGYETARPKLAFFTVDAEGQRKPGPPMSVYVNDRGDVQVNTPGSKIPRGVALEVAAWLIDQYSEPEAEVVLPEEAVAPVAEAPAE